jgi:type III secretion protein W
MSERIEGGLALRERRLETGGAEPQAAEGSYRGETVRLQGDPLSLLKDAAEELTFAHSERVEQQEIGERKVEGRFIGLPPPGAIEKLFDKLPDTGGAEKLREAVDRILKSGAGSPQQLLELAQQSYDDVSFQFLLLQEVRRQLEESGGDPGLARITEEALAQLEAAHGPEIRAGLNAAEAIAEFAQGDPARARELRQFYRDSVLGFEKIGDTYQALLGKFGVEGFPDGVAFLIKAAGDDLGAMGPSTPAPALKQILDDLYQLEVVSTVHERCSRLEQSMSRLYGERPSGTPQELAGELMSLTGDRSVSPQRIERLVDGLGVGEGEPRIALLRELKEIVRLIPLKVYQEPDQRELLRDAVQGALDTAIENEA